MAIAGILLSAAQFSRDAIRPERYDLRSQDKGGDTLQAKGNLRKRAMQVPRRTIDRAENRSGERTGPHQWKARWKTPETEAIEVDKS